MYPMRLFLNAIFDLGKLKIPFSQVLPLVRRILSEHNWSTERILFHLEDINDASQESQTAHQKMAKAFPQLAPYWNSSFAARKSQLINSRAQPHQFSYFSNFPGRKEGNVVFAPEDTQVTDVLLEAVCAKIPKPYSFYGAVMVLDGIHWFPDTNVLPAMDWNIYGKTEEENWDPGDWPLGLDFSETIPFYQCNGIVISKRFDMTPELDLRVELTESHDREEACRIVACFAEVLGMPGKQCVRAVHPWEEREEHHLRILQMQAFYDTWIRKVREDLQAEENSFLTQYPRETKGSAGRKTLQNRFLKANGFQRHALRRWDDRGWYKRLAHHFWLHVTIEFHSGGRSQDTLGIVCYGCNFQLRSGIHMQAHPSLEENPSGLLTFHCFQLFLSRFEAEAVPELAKIFGDMPKAFYQDSDGKNIRDSHQILG